MISILPHYPWVVPRSLSKLPCIPASRDSADLVCLQVPSERDSSGVVLPGSSIQNISLIWPCLEGPMGTAWSLIVLCNSLLLRASVKTVLLDHSRERTHKWTVSPGTCILQNLTVPRKVHFSLSANQLGHDFCLIVSVGVWWCLSCHLIPHSHTRSSFVLWKNQLLEQCDFFFPLSQTILLCCPTQICFGGLPQVLKRNSSPQPSCKCSYIHKTSA